MFLLDDIVMAPVKGFAAVCRKIQEVAEQEQDANEKAVMADLAELHRLVESGEIDDDDFNARESVLLDQLARFQKG